MGYDRVPSRRPCMPGLSRTFRIALFLILAVLLGELARSQSPQPIAPGKPSLSDAVDAKTATNSIGMKLVLIPAGTFLMGSADEDKEAYDNEKPRHRVAIAKGFYLG